MNNFVSNATGRLRKVLLCPPDYYKLQPINYVASKWVDTHYELDKEKCKKQHHELIRTYEANGVEVELMIPNPELVYEVFARDFGACIAEGYILGNFRETLRKGETIAYENKMKELGIPCVARCTAGVFEGGDFFFIDDYTMAVGMIARTDAAGFDNIKRQVNDLGYEMISVPAERKYLHLDVCANIVAEKVAVVCPEILPPSFIRALKKRNYELVTITEEEVIHYDANIQCLGNEKVLSSCHNEAVNSRLKTLGLEVIEIDVSEIVKGGGGIHCMTFPLHRDKK